MTDINLHLIAPVIALAFWSMLICAWMMVTRVSAIVRSGMKLDPVAPRGEQMALLPARVRWKADNYNHLMEQPTLFYAVTLSLAILGDHTMVSLWLVWAYVVLRIVHSLVQIVSNRIVIRFALFSLSSLVLFAMICWVMISRLG
ncbi:MAG: MAPEG family protein [Proteobacteria bacterium]|nr:MAPEG family protein [Pseudomonadota bacterium]HQR03043.1 MAPEG family protein [Rhodocyclaceae bacterium]